VCVLERNNKILKKSVVGLFSTNFAFFSEKFLMVTGGVYTSNKINTILDQVDLLTFDAINNPKPSCLKIDKLPTTLYAHAGAAPAKCENK
jgi:hypothetical protein